MEIIDEEQPLGHVKGSHRRIIISRRDTILNDLKNSTVQGLLSFIASILSVLTVLSGFLLSFREAGDSGYYLGLIMILALLLAVFSLIMGILGLKNRKKIRHYMEKRGLVISIICILSLIALYVYGILRYLEVL